MKKDIIIIKLDMSTKREPSQSHHSVDLIHTKSLNYGKWAAAVSVVANNLMTTYIYKIDVENTSLQCKIQKSLGVGISKKTKLRQAPLMKQWS